MYIRVSITVYDAMQFWTYRRICVWSPWQVYAHFTYIAGRNNSDTILSVIFIAKESYTSILRDRPFNLKGVMGGFFRWEKHFRTTQELEYLFFLSRNARKFFPAFNIRLYDKNSESDYFFSSTKIRIFQQHWESEYFFRRKPWRPHFKLNGCSLTWREVMFFF